MRRAIAAAMLWLLALGGPVAARDFVERLHETMAPWRSASWYARTGNTGLAAVEVEDFRARWAVLAKEFPAPPPPFAGDARWGETLGLIDGLAAGAATALDGDDAEAGMRLLNGVADALAELRRRHGVADFSDVVAAYRAAIDRVAALLRPDDRLDDERLGRLRRAARELKSAADDLEPGAPAKFLSSAEFAESLARNRDGVAALVAAAGRPGASALEIVGLIRVVRSHYALLFLRYGALVSGFAAA